MADGYCFISYSTADALDFARKLANKLEGGTPEIPVWFDKDDLKPGDDWDIQIDEALRTCKLLLFVMSKDSVMDNSVCKQEWSRALSYKKPIIPILIHNGIVAPFRLADRQRIDFRSSFDAGLAQLRDHISWMDAPEGQLQEVKEQRVDARRALNRAKPEDQARIQQLISDLDGEIKRREEILKNPKAAEEQTKINIETGLERERNPEKPISGKATTKFINPPPGIAPNYFQDRYDENIQIRDFLSNPSQRLLTVVGRAGIGKTAMVCRLLKALESGHLPDDLGEHLVDGIIYLGESGSHKVNFVNIFTDLCKLLPGEYAAKLEGLYKDPKVSVESKTLALMEAFNDGQVILLLDNFESLIETENIRDTELSEALNTFLCGPHHTIKITLTTRIAPHELNICEPGRQYVLRLDEGLEHPHAENMLKEMDASGKLGIKNAPIEILSRARVRTRGYPRALEALVGILSADYSTTLEELVSSDENVPLPEDVVKKLVGDAFNRLDPVAQKVMQALAIYNRPVTSSAVDYLLQPHVEGINSSLILQRLVNMHFARREAGKFYLHPVDGEYAVSRLPRGDEIKDENPERTRMYRQLGIKPPVQERTDFTQIGLTSRAADYFALARKPREEWKKLDDLSAQLAEFDLRYTARDYDTAASIMVDIGFDYLLLWGHYRLSFGLFEKVSNNICDEFLRENTIGSMGITCYYMAQYQKALYYHSMALRMSEEQGNKSGQAIWLNWIANSYSNMGQIQDSIIKYKLSLKLARETHDEKSEGITLSNLGIAYADLGDAQQAVNLHEQALNIAHNTGNLKGESNCLGNLGFALLNLGEYQKAKTVFIQSLEIADKLSDTRVQLEERWGLAQAYLFQSDLENARLVIEAALQFDVPEYNHNASALLGIIALRQGDLVIAHQALTSAVTQAHEIFVITPEYYSTLDAKGLALCGLTICDDTKYLPEAIQSFRAARKIAPHVGIIKNNLRLFDELAKCDTEGILKDVRPAVEGKEPPSLRQAQYGARPSP